ncbi:MAG TPA: hypothetical protein VJM79_01985, partial [Rhizorhapis sp.]|nr:hypothetical protein [Rhizorhapis sp.]
GRADVSQAGEYAIYGDDPVSIVELKGICLPRIAGGCGDYPAQVLEEWGSIEIITRDAKGALPLKKCG